MGETPGRTIVEPRRFDAITRVLGERRSRREALKTTAAGLGAAVVAGAINRTAGAQDATPSADATIDDTSFLFVQTAASGTFRPNPNSGTPVADEGTSAPGGGADYLLILEQHGGETIYFSDRPERIFGEAATPQFLEGLGFTPANPPNAALVARTGDSEDVLVIELIDPHFDEAAGTLTYGANVLTDYTGDGLAHAASLQRDLTFAEEFANASLFIDDCPDITNCYLGPVSMGPVPYSPINTCWQWSSLSCKPCDGRAIERISASCNATYSNCNNLCTVFVA
jgi:hypothetical protein